MAHPTVDMETPRVAVASACVLGEGPVWDHRNDTLLWVDIKDPAIWRYHPGTGKHSRIEAPERVGFVALTHDPDIVIAGFKSGLVRFNLWGGEDPAARVARAGQPGNRINDGHVGPDGRLYFGTMDDEENEPTGAFWRWDGKELMRFRDDIVVTNGPAFSPDGRTIYTHRHPAAHGPRAELSMATAPASRASSSSSMRRGESRRLGGRRRRAIFGSAIGAARASPGSAPDGSGRAHRSHAHRAGHQMRVRRAGS